MENNMNHYKVWLCGRGADLYLHKIDEDQKKMLSEMKIEDTSISIDFDKLNEVLKVEHYDYSDEVFTGTYSSKEYYHIIVFDKDDKKIWEQDDEFQLEEGEETEDYILLETTNKLLIEHSVKGTLKVFNLDIEEEFNPNKLSYKCVSVNEEVELITDLKYDNKVMEMEDWGDYWSKGIFCYIL